MTTNVVEGLTSGTSAPVQVHAGRYLLALSGTFDGASVQIYAHVGVAADAPLTDLLYTGPAAQIVWLPHGTLYASVGTPGGSTSVNIALAPVIQDVE